MTKPAYLITPNSISVVFPDADPAIVYSSSPAYQEITEAIKRLDWESVRVALSPGQRIAKQFNEAFGSEVIVVESDQILYYGKPLHNVVTERILHMLEDGYDVSPMVRFLERLMKNPSYAAVEELFLFLESSGLPITEDGCFLAYKRIRLDWTDQYTGKIDHSIGAKPEMERNQVDDNRHNTCSDGLHFCAFGYLPHYGADYGGRVIVVKIDPADVVAIPSDYNNQKGRACRYEVVRELELEGRSRHSTPEERLEGDFEPTEEERRVMITKNMVAQIIPLTGEVKAYYDSVGDASSKTDVDSSSISKVIRGLRQTAGGYGWQWAETSVPAEDEGYTVSVNYPDNPMVEDLWDRYDSDYRYNEEDEEDEDNWNGPSW